MVSRSTLRPIEILLVADKASDIRLTEEALRDGEVTNNLTVVGDCDTALQILRPEGRSAAAAEPNLILLDLGLPGKSGLEVLREIRTDPRLGRIVADCSEPPPAGVRWDRTEHETQELNSSEGGLTR